MIPVPFPGFPWLLLFHFLMGYPVCQACGSRAIIECWFYTAVMHTGEQNEPVGNRELLGCGCQRQASQAAKAGFRSYRPVLFDSHGGGKI